MKHFLLIAAFFLVMIKVQSQNVGIGTSTPATILDVVSTTKGILIPRLNTIQMNAIVSPANGLIITNTDSSNRIFIYTGAGWKGLSFTSEGSNGIDISAMVHKTGMDSITGTKIFTSDIFVHGLTIGRGSGADSTNTAIGIKALFSNSFGQYNTALGDNSLFSNFGGTANTSIGNTALFSNTSGGSNTADGYQALYSNTTGNFNTGGGAYALYYNAGGTDNVAYGFAAANYISGGFTPLETANNSLFLGANTRAQGNNQTNQVVIGNNAVGDGDNSTVIGNSSILSTKIQGKLKLPAYGTGANTGTALFNLATDSNGNIIEVASGNGGIDTISGNKIFTSDISVHGLTIGRGSGGDSTNTAIGNKALFLNSFGQYNTALGDNSLFTNFGGTANTSIGNTALFSNTSGGSNTADGYQALYSNTTGDFNTGGGAYALYYNVGGTDNVAYGFAAANYISGGFTPLETANNSLFLGANTRAQGNNQTNQVVIGNNAVGDGDNSTVIGNTSILSTKIQGKLKLPAYGTGSNTGTALFNLATDGNGNIIEVASGNGSSNVLIGTTTDDAVNKLQINGAIKSTQFNLSALNTAPTSASDTGILGEVRITSNYIYVCIATNTWVRSPLTTW